MIIRKFVPTDLKRVFEIENMSFDQSYGINMFQQLYEMGIGFLVAEEDNYVIGYVMFWIKYENPPFSYIRPSGYKRQKPGRKPCMVQRPSLLKKMHPPEILLSLR